MKSLRDLLTDHGFQYEQDELVDFFQAFEVLDDLTNGKLNNEQKTAAFAALRDVCQDDSAWPNAHLKMKKCFALLEELDAIRGKLDRKEKLFFSFAVYVSCKVISEKDEKKHSLTGLPELNSSDEFKMLMEEYWGFDPYMFRVD